MTCSEGTHVIGYPPTGRFRECRKCGVSEQTIYDSPQGAALDDFRVVCTEPGCDYGTRVDSDGNGYTNHVLLHLAKAALRRHQRSADEPHRVKIQQHPIEAVVEMDEPTKRRHHR